MLYFEEDRFLGHSKVDSTIMSTAFFRVHEHTIQSSHIREYPRATADGQEDVLQLAVKQYVPRETFTAKSEVTVIGAHANGFPKVGFHLLLYHCSPLADITIRSCTSRCGTSYIKS